MRRSLLIVLLVFGAWAVQAQSDFKKEFYIGAKGGISATQVRFYPNVQQSFFQGNTGGLVLRMISEPHIGIQLEVNYIEKGWQEKPLTEGSEKQYFHRLNYIDIPVMTHVNLGKKALRFTLNLGPSMSYLYGEEQGFKPSGDFPAESEFAEEYWNQPIDSKFDFLFTGGLGVEYHLKGGSAISLEGRAFYSLPNLFDSDNYSYKSSQSNGAQVTLAYLFRLNRDKK